MENADFSIKLVRPGQSVVKMKLRNGIILPSVSKISMLERQVSLDRFVMKTLFVLC